MTRMQAVGLGLSVLQVAALATLIDRTLGWAELATFWRKADPWVAIPAKGLLVFPHRVRALSFLPNLAYKATADWHCSARAWQSV